MTAATQATPSDMDLVRDFVERKDKDAFAQLVRRHVDMVYATALRRVRDRHLAEDVTQATFIILADRARRFDDRVLVAGWLHRAAGYAARNALKIESRRKRHERYAAETAMTSVDESTSTGDRWSDIEPQLDAAIDELGQTDRAAIVMRFQQEKSVEETATALGVSAEAAKKRIQRALARLRSILSRKGVEVPAASLTAAIASHGTATAAPPQLADRATTAALEGSASGSLIAKGALTMMLWTKIRLAALMGAMVIVLAGAGALAVSLRGPSDRPAPPAPPRFAFGDVIERTVNDDGLGKDECIDFDTGKLHSHPEPFRDRAEGRAWFRSTGADAHGETEEGSTGLFAMEMAVLPVGNEMWDAEAPELRDIIHDAPGAVGRMSGDDELPQTYLFRTREGGLGICQILEVTRDAQQHGFMRIRYKLIRST